MNNKNKNFGSRAPVQVSVVFIIFSYHTRACCVVVAVYRWWDPTDCTGLPSRGSPIRNPGQLDPRHATPCPLPRVPQFKHPPREADPGWSICQYGWHLLDFAERHGSWNVARGKNPFQMSVEVLFDEIIVILYHKQRRVRGVYDVQTGVPRCQQKTIPCIIMDR